MDLCSFVCDTKSPEGSVNCGICECRTKSEMRLLPSPVATENYFSGNKRKGRECSSVGFLWQMMTVLSN